MKLSKPVTLINSTTATAFLLFKVTEVTVKVTVKAVCRYILYNIVTLVTLLLVYTPHARAHTRTCEMCNFSGNQVTGEQKRYAAVKKTVTFKVTWLPLNPFSYLKIPVTCGGV